MNPYKALSTALSRQLVRAMWKGVEGVPIVDWYSHGPTQAVLIDAADRVQGLAALWAAARYCFAYWETIPHLDWDKAFREFVPRAMATLSPADYYRLLAEFVALLQDGHSYVLTPPWLKKEEASPSLLIQAIEGRPVVVEGHALPVGSVITQVDGVPSAARLATCMKTISASTEHDRLNKACARLLVGPAACRVAVVACWPDGREHQTVLMRDGPLPLKPVFEQEHLGAGRVLVRLNGWHSPEVVDQFQDAFPDFDGVRSLILDVRHNRGGSDENARAILARLIREPVSGLTSQTPLYWGAMSIVGLDRPMLTTLDEPIQPDRTRLSYDGPVVVLTGAQTYSAAEDFCLVFQASKRGLLVGDITGGSTGNPAILKLPGGGVGAICATKTSCANGGTFVGKGVVPDILVRPTVQGITSGRDEILEAALSTLKPRNGS